MPSLTLVVLVLSLSLLSPAASDATFIRKTCKTTKYFDLCVSSLESDPASQTSDARGLALIMIAAGVANSTATSAYLSSRIPTSSGGPTVSSAVKKALKECSEEYSYAADALRAAARDLAAADGVDYAYVHVSAAADYPNSCRNAFMRSPGLAYPREIARREEGLKRICDVVLGITDNIGW